MLNNKGVQCAANLSWLLPNFLTSKHLNPINKVITMDPRQPDPNIPAPTPNPFDTVWPLINAQRNSIGSVSLLAKNSTYDIITQATTTDNGSILIGYDRENLWGVEDRAGRDSVLYLLTQKLGIPASALPTWAPCKCINLYVFTQDPTNTTQNKLKVYSLGTNYDTTIPGKAGTCY